jgi:hypothetical protein
MKKLLLILVFGLFTQALLAQIGRFDEVRTNTVRGKDNKDTEFDINDGEFDFKTNTFKLDGESADSMKAVQDAMETYPNNIGNSTTSADTIFADVLELDDELLTPEATIKELNFAADAEASDTYVITLSPAISSLTTGMMIVFTANTANTGACTLNVNSIGAVSLKSLHDQDPPNDYIESGSVVMVVYDGTNFQIISPDANP